ncbi:MAG: Trk system potassium transporter TrkA [Lachnospiraceae bacterium]|jgi:trk system potassium uptake protein TrkA|nr:Trk system potassium transporter TrkA [Lachnospiraceae bacterium]
MQIIIVGCGNVGATLTEQLSKEGHNITVIDTDAQRAESVANRFDVMGVVGNGASFNVQNEAGIEEADLLIAVTTSDELNLLCCLIARKTGGCNTVARVRNPIYNREIGYIKEELGLSMVINPEYAAASEIARLLKFPSAIKVDTFAKGRVELLQCKIGEGSVLGGQPLTYISSGLHCDVLICSVERGEEVYIPSGNFELQEKDVITVVASSKKANEFFRKIGMATNRIKSCMIIGGGETTYYLAKQLLPMGISIKIIEQDKERCNELSDLLPQAMVIHGDGTERNLLYEEGLLQAHSFVSWTSLDEENIMLSLFAQSVSKAKTITKVHRIDYDEIIDKLDLGSVLYPKNITAEYILQYVRAMQNSIGSNVETLYRLIDGKVEALEFRVRERSELVGVPLKELQLKENVLIACISRRGIIITPGGQDTIEVGDTVAVVTTNQGFHDLRDILK